MALVYLTESAGPGAGRPHQEERSSFVGVALAPIRTAPLLTDGMDLPLLDDLLNCRNFAGSADRTAQPRGHTFNYRGAIAGLLAGLLDEMSHNGSAGRVDRLSKLALW